MKISEIIRESVNTPIQMEEELVAYIKENCQPWLQQTNNGMLRVYRGTPRGVDNKPFIRQIRTDRVPFDSSMDYHNFFNKLIDIIDPRKMAPRRHNAAFVTSRQREANYYGNPYVFMPIGEFSFVWSPAFRDWHAIESWAHEMSRWDEYEKILKQDIVDKLPHDKKITDKLEYSVPPMSWVDKNKIKQNILTTDLHAAINSGNEIMIKASAGLYVPIDVYTRIQPKLHTKKKLDNHKII